MIGLSRTTLVVFTLLTLSAILVLGNKPPQATKADSGKLLQANGTVTVNGTAAISGATVLSDSTVTTAARSSAVVSLGKLGRVEVLPESTMKLGFDDSNVSVAMLDQGRVRISSSSNVSASVTTADGQITSQFCRLP